MAHIKVVVAANSKERLNAVIREKLPGEEISRQMVSKNEIPELVQKGLQMLITDKGEMISVDQIVWHNLCGGGNGKSTFQILINAYCKSLRNSQVLFAVVDCHI